MKAANGSRACNEEAPAYGEAGFLAKANELESIHQALTEVWQQGFAE